MHMYVYIYTRLHLRMYNIHLHVYTYMYGIIPKKTIIYKYIIHVYLHTCDRYAWHRPPSSDASQRAL